jgi:hypothetical protein
LTLYRGFGPIAIACLLAGCISVSKKSVVPPSQIRTSLDSNKEALLDQYNHQANAVVSLNATVELIPTAGSNYSGVIEQYHQVSGFILAQKPAQIRMIGQAPVIASNVFDMVSDGQTFRIYIPSKKKFLVGPANLERTAKNPIENLRPQHLLDALLWPVIGPQAPVPVPGQAPKVRPALRRGNWRVKYGSIAPIYRLCACKATDRRDV